VDEVGTVGEEGEGEGEDGAIDQTTYHRIEMRKMKALVHEIGKKIQTKKQKVKRALTEGIA
jgi:hypothetical protein